MMEVENRRQVMGKSKADKQEIRLEVLFVIAIGIYMFIWSVLKPFNYAPDEQMRYDLPLYIYNHGRLPLGDDPEIRNQIWGFSYAFMPTWLEPIIAAFFMHVVSIFGASEFKLVVAARFVSVLSISGMVYCLARTLDRLFSRRVKWMTLILISMLPQITFLGSYVNQDSLNLLGTSIILLSWVCGIHDGWNYKNGLLLSAGIIVVSLSYYFGYGWILGSILYFFITHLLQIGPNKPDKKMWKVTALICILVLGVVSFFFIRNLVIYHGDLLGRASMGAAQSRYATTEMKPENRLSLMSQGVPFVYFLISREWWRSTLNSFIGCFGYMQYPVPGWIWVTYFLMFLLFITIFIVSTAKLAYNKCKSEVVFRAFIILEFVIPIILSLWYSYSSDYQAQGRYIMSLIPALTIESAVGIAAIDKRKNIVTVILTGIVVVLALYSFIGVYLPS